MQQRGLDFDPPRPRGPRPLTVSELNERVRGILERELADVWVEGEISNLSTPASGHWYFSLKDERCQVRAVAWKTDVRLFRFRPKDGLKVLVRGSVRVYDVRGEYQLQVQRIEPLGKGSLQQAFEELKEKLGREGLFDERRKRALPLLPRRIGVVTSPTGAVIRDILRVLASRYANLSVLVYPARVQGEGSAIEVAQGIAALGRTGVDVIIVARGGGSIEDLWAFNEEIVARALAASPVPTISAVGHETDFTIADFVADLRAPTPSAAAERVIQAKSDLAHRVEALAERLVSATRLRVARSRGRLQDVSAARAFEAERGRLRTLAQWTDELDRRTDAGLRRGRERAAERLRHATERLDAFRLERQLEARRERLLRLTRALEVLPRRLAALLAQSSALSSRLTALPWSARLTALRERTTHAAVRSGSSATATLAARRAAVGTLAAKLHALSPLAVLGRGYALVRHGERIVRSTDDVALGDVLHIRLASGTLGATVSSKETP